jgi:pseudaminic acid biosynthesis-associated methylase
MSVNGHQVKTWKSRFGRDYTDRNTLNLKELDMLYKKNIGITREELNRDFIGSLSRNFKVLEVGSNVGNQLILLKKMGFKNLYGIELNSYAVERSKSRAEGINIIQGSAFDIPFKDNFFDLVFTSGVLIHINPKVIQKAIGEIHRCALTYIWGCEYFAEDGYVAGGEYRGQRNMFWKTDFARLYLNSFKDLTLLKERRFKYLSNENVDTVFLLKKKKS